MTGTRVFITGATGFIGSHLTRLLVHQGYTVFALVRPTADLWRISDLTASINLVEGDLAAFDSWERELQSIRPEVCFHLAWFNVPREFISSLENLQMLHVSLRLADYLARSGCKKLIAAGTCAEYDSDFGYLSETSQTKPRSLYAACKLALFLILEQQLPMLKMDFAWMRLFHLYGPREDSRRLVPYVICSLLRNEPARLTTGDQIRDFLHVEDVAAALWATGEGNLTGPINVGSGKPIAVRDIASQIGNLLDRSHLIRLGAEEHWDTTIPFICANNMLLKTKTNWAPQFSLADGLQHTIAWWRSHIDAPNLV